MASRPLSQATLEITALSHDGRGIATLDGKKIFVSGGLPGETVTATIKLNKRRYALAQIETVANPSPLRVTPHCPHFGVCGGCALQHLEQSEQIKLKQSVLEEQLWHFGQIKPSHWLPPIKTEPYGYRRKARIGIKYVVKKEKLLMGFREKDGRFVTDCHTCAVLVPELSRLWEPLKALIGGLSIYNQVPQIEVIAADAELALILRHMEPLSDADQTALVDFAKAQGITWYLQPKGPNTVHKLWPDDGVMRLSYALPGTNLTLRSHPNDFMQVNRVVNQKMIAQALDLLDLKPTDKVLDLFCGAGNFTLPLAQQVSAVVGVEGDAPMVSRVLENAQANQLTNVTAYEANLFDTVPNFPFKGQTFDKILIDPPRTGAKEVIDWISGLKASLICYVSCNPATLARDAGLLAAQGYQLKSVGIMDMFTHTEHTEAMALFERVTDGKA